MADGCFFSIYFTLPHSSVKIKIASFRFSLPHRVKIALAYLIQFALPFLRLPLSLTITLPHSHSRVKIDFVSVNGKRADSIICDDLVDVS